MFNFKITKQEPKYPNFLNIDNRSVVSELEKLIIDNLKEIISDLIHCHKGASKNKNYFVEFNSDNGVYSIFYKKNKVPFATLKIAEPDLTTNDAKEFVVKWEVTTGDNELIEKLKIRRDGKK